MYPNLTVKIVETPSTLHEFIKGLGANYLYSFERKVVGVTVNGNKMWPTAKLRPGDKVIIFPIITGG